MEIITFLLGVSAATAAICTVWRWSSRQANRRNKRGPLDTLVPGPRYRIPPPPALEPRIFYLCDHRACEQCYPCGKCKHTLHIEHAKNFERFGRSYREIGPNAIADADPSRTRV